MKKKFLALIMAGVMLTFCPAAVMAEETEVAEEEMPEIEEIDYSMIDETVYEGTWVSAFGVFDLYLPSDWDVLVNVDLEEEEAPENSIYFQAASEDQARSVAISYAPSEFTSIEDVAAAYSEQGFDEVGYMYINDILVVTYTLLDENGVQTAGIVALGDQGGLYNVTIGAPADDAEFGPIAQNIVASFSATENEEEAE